MLPMQVMAQNGGFKVVLDAGHGGKDPGCIGSNRANREKDIALRLLNDKRAHDERMKIQLISTISPVAILALIGGIVFVIRKRRYEK